MRSLRSFGGGARKFRGAPTVLFALPILLIAVLAFWFTRPDDDPFDAAAIINPAFPSLTYGVQAFLWWDSSIASVHLDWIRMMSFSHVKQVFAWDDMEPVSGEWRFEQSDRIVDEVQRRGLQLVVRLSDAPAWAHPSVVGVRGEDYIDAPPDAEFVQAWVNYCTTVATRYQGRIAAYQIWNEPNLSREWGNRTPDAAAYTELLRLCSEEIHAVDPDVILISAGLSPTGNQDDLAHRDDIYLQAMYDAGFQQYIDVVGVHAPGYTAPEYGPDDAERDGNGRWATFRRIEDLRKIMIANGDAARQVAILEIGWTTDQREGSPYTWFGVSEETQAEYLVRAYQYAYEHWRPWVGLMSVIYIASPDWTPEDEQWYWAITQSQVEMHPAGTTRLSYLALASMPKYCGDTIIPERGEDYQLPLDIMQIPICVG